MKWTSHGMSLSRGKIWICLWNQNLLCFSMWYQSWSCLRSKLHSDHCSGFQSTFRCSQSLWFWLPQNCELPLMQQPYKIKEQSNDAKLSRIQYFWDSLRYDLIYEQIRLYLRYSFTSFHIYQISPHWLYYSVDSYIIYIVY